MKAKTPCFNCKITQNDVEIHNQDYITLKDISEDLGLSYNQVADISSQRIKHKNNNFRFYPKIEITRINRK
tara:strand:+ start:1308 stop:1520 length:213 start_codon:yes stop_codon:yes gene_type:complete